MLLLFADILKLASDNALDHSSHNWEQTLQQSVVHVGVSREFEVSNVFFLQLELEVLLDTHDVLVTIDV